MTATKAMKGAPNRFSIYVAFVLLVILALLVKGCTDNEPDHLFIFKDAISWN